MLGRKIIAFVVTDAPLTEVRFAAAAHDFSLVVEPAPDSCRYDVILADDVTPRPNLARTLRMELSRLWPGTVVSERGS